MEKRAPVASVGVVCFRDDAVLLVRRGNAPLRGAWTLPGGKIEWGERAGEAALRELKEETGVEAALLGVADIVDAVFASRATGEIWGHYLIVEYAAIWRAGEAIAGDDAAEARFVALDALDGETLTPEVRDIIAKAARLVSHSPRAPWPDPTAR